MKTPATRTVNVQECIAVTPFYLIYHKCRGDGARQAVESAGEVV